ncbi:hypothetical protein G6L37_02955 [Agrobacterium rubi]|nr:hypothetical protein [Agrobacterium rubi]NTF24337.1 hypothetical protein [Agrobacterium rubi]
MPSKIRMLSIELEQATGTHIECQRRATVHDWAAVDPILRSWDSDRPEKVDYVIRFEDGEVSEGTVEIGTAGEKYGFRSFQSDVTSGLRALMSLDPERARYREWIDPKGEKRSWAIAAGAKYDFGIDTSEPPLADASILQDYMNDDNEGRDAEITLAGSEDTPTIIFADGEPLMVETADAARYLLRQWRILNNIHPILGGDTPLIEEAQTPGLAQ